MKNAISVARGVTVCGKPCTVTLSDSERNLLSSFGILVGEQLKLGVTLKLLQYR